MPEKLDFPTEEEARKWADEHDYVVDEVVIHQNNVTLVYHPKED